MEKYLSIIKIYPFIQEGFELIGEVRDGVLYVKAETIVGMNINKMTRLQIYQCMSHGNNFAWKFAEGTYKPASIKTIANLKPGDDYYVVIEGEVCTLCFTNSDFDREFIKSGNAFVTKNELNIMRRKFNMGTEIRKDNKKHNNILKTWTNIFNKIDDEIEVVRVEESDDHKKCFIYYLMPYSSIENEYSFDMSLEKDEAVSGFCSNVRQRANEMIYMIKSCAYNIENYFKDAEEQK